MIYGIIGGAFFLVLGYWLTEQYYYHPFPDYGTLGPLHPDVWLKFSLSITLLLFCYLLLRFKFQKPVRRHAELAIFIALFSVSNLCQWDKNHSGWGIGELGALPSAGLFGIHEPLVFDFIDRTPRLSDRIESVFHKPEYPTLWGQYKAQQNDRRIQTTRYGWDPRI